MLCNVLFLPGFECMHSLEHGVWLGSFRKPRASMREFAFDQQPGCHPEAYGVVMIALRNEWSNDSRDHFR